MATSCTDSIPSIFGHSKITPNSMTLASLPIRCFGHQVLAKISVRPHWAGNSNFTSFWEQSFNQRLSQDYFIFFTLSTETRHGYVKHAKLRCFPYRNIPPLSQDSHVMLTVIDIWDGSCSYWRVFALVIVLLD